MYKDSFLSFAIKNEIFLHVYHRKKSIKSKRIGSFFNIYMTNNIFKQSYVEVRICRILVSHELTRI